MATGANDVLVVQGDAESLDERERLIPFIDSVATEVDVQGRRICVDWDPEF
jgi:RimM protein, required for 16S rRNA processing